MCAFESTWLGKSVLMPLDIRKHSGGEELFRIDGCKPIYIIFNLDEVTLQSSSPKQNILSLGSGSEYVRLLNWGMFLVTISCTFPISSISLAVVGDHVWTLHSNGWWTCQEKIVSIYIFFSSRLFSPTVNFSWIRMTFKLYTSLRASLDLLLDAILEWLVDLSREECEHAPSLSYCGICLHARFKWMVSDFTTVVL